MVFSPSLFPFMMGWSCCGFSFAGAGGLREGFFIFPFLKDGGFLFDLLLSVSPLAEHDDGAFSFREAFFPSFPGT